MKLRIITSNALALTARMLACEFPATSLPHVDVFLSLATNRQKASPGFSCTKVRL